MGNVTLLTKDNFENFIQAPLAIVDFWAPWCGPCRALAPTLDKVAQEQNILMGKMSIEDEDSQNFVQKYQIRSIPTLLFFKHGLCVESHVGAISEQDLIEKINTHAK